MAARDLKASMARGSEIPKSREEYLNEKIIAEEIVEKSPEPLPISRPISKAQTPSNNIEYVRKGYYALTEENYWYLKDITFYKDMKIQDYLNWLIEKDREEHKDILNNLPHCK